MQNCPSQSIPNTLQPDVSQQGQVTNVGVSNPQSVSASPVQSGNTSLQVSQPTVPSNVVPGPNPQQRPIPGQQWSTHMLCFVAQNMVHEIVNNVLDLFNYLRILSPPQGSPQSLKECNDRRRLIYSHVDSIKKLFKQLRILYDRCNDESQLQGMEYMHIESFIPIKEEWDMKTSEERKTSEAYRIACEERDGLIKQVTTKNTEIKEIINQLRKIVWEVNTMLLMKKT